MLVTSKDTVDSAVDADYDVNAQMLNQPIVGRKRWHNTALWKAPYRNNCIALGTIPPANVRLREVVAL